MGKTRHKNPAPPCATSNPAPKRSPRSPRSWHPAAALTDQRRCADLLIWRLALILTSRVPRPLTPYADRRARTLSMGNLQRLALAKALIHAPDLLILDEPVNGLDPAGVVEIRTLLAGLAHQHGTTVLLSSRLLAEVARLATRIGIIHHGHLFGEHDTDGLEQQLERRLSIP
ncbi:ATP-binding cassette domain-containing protein [Nonomuraea insulae]|uniref:ATP-binding cassette domain-containing protein n=1 Tax=Nonomuraea insulae TaxID=1616787 RepID=A0ABW1CUL4_9ACTN